MPRLRVKVTGLARANQIPGWIERGQRETLELATERIRDSIRRASPGGRIAADITSRTISSTRAVIEADQPATRALDRGAYIRSKRGAGTAIRFTAGGQRVFVRAPRGSRIRARNFFKKGLRPRRRIIQETFDEVMGHLG